MLIQNTSSAVAAPGFTSNGAPVAVAAPQTQAAPAAKAAPEQQPAAPTAAQLQSAVDSINKAMQQNNANVEFSIDHDTKQAVIKVIESTTGEVIRQFPTEDVLAISREIDQFQQRGLLLQQKA